MDLRQLRTFIAVADAGGVARAATMVNLSQPARLAKYKRLRWNWEYVCSTVSVAVSD